MSVYIVIGDSHVLGVFREKDDAIKSIQDAMQRFTLLSCEYDQFVHCDELTGEKFVTHIERYEIS